MARRGVLVAAGLFALAVVLLRCAWVCDDAYISFRTVDNGVHGYGARWNVDERVQAFTSPLWVGHALRSGARAVARPLLPGAGRLLLVFDRRSRVRMIALLSAAVAVSGTAYAQARPAAKPKSAPAPVVAPGTEAVVETPKGSFTIRLLPEVAPKHVALFVKTAKAGGYDGTTFHRVIAGGIIQGGDPLSKDKAKASLYGTGGLGLLPAEFSDRPFVRGTVAAARRPSSNDSGGKQFFVCLQPQPSLQGQYTIFGEVVSGMEVADQIGNTPVNGQAAAERVEMKVTIREPAVATNP